MKNIFIIIIIFCITTSSVFAQNKDNQTPTSLYFHGGKIVAAEIKEKPANLINVSPYEPPSKITRNIGWAAVVVKMDRGRTLGIYDYVLKNKNKKVFPCVALREMSLPFDAKKWRIDKTDPKKYYYMLFKVERPGLGKPEFILHYKLGKSKDITLQFQKADYSFTPSGLIPAEGMYGLPPKGNQKPPQKKPPVVSKPPTKKPPVKTDTKKITFPKANYKVSAQGGPNTSIDKVFDGNMKTEWHTHSNNEKHWIRIKIPGGKKPIDKIVIKWGNSYPKVYRVVTKEVDKKEAPFKQISNQKNNKGGTSTIKVNSNVEVIKIVDMSQPAQKGGAKAIFKIKEIEVFLK